MSKIESLTSITTGYNSQQQVNSNFDKITTAFTNTLSRDGSSPNTLLANMDLNGYKVTNLGTPTANSDAVTKSYVDDNTSAGGIAQAAASATASAASATAAATSATSAATQATNAATSATNAATSATNASTSASAAAASAALFDTVSVITSTSNAIACNLATARVFKHTFTEATTFTFSNPATTGTRCAFELHLFQDGTGRTPTWPGTVKWSNGTAPTVNTASKNYMVSFYTIDGGTTYIGILSAEAFA